MRSYLAAWVMACLALASLHHAAIAQEMSPVKGQVVFSGKALQSGKILFHADKARPVEAEIKNGEYSTMLPAGVYAVTVDFEACPANYKGADHSGLRVTVTRGKNTFHFELFSDSSKEPAGDVAALERFVGTWEVDGKWSSGEPLHARGVYEWGLGKKIMTAKTFVKDADREYQRYESIMAWNPEKKSLYEITFAYDGSITEVLIDCKGPDTFQIGFTPFNPAKPGRVRQVLRFLDNDRFQWTVTLNEGDKWNQLIDATWKRVKK